MLTLIDRLMRGAQIIVRSESVLALLPPFIAMTWVIADATMGLVAADRSSAAAIPASHITSAAETYIVVEAKSNEVTLTICSPDSTVAAAIDHTQTILLGLCQAGLKFTSGLPKT
jgi:hypothetical protein